MSVSKTIGGTDVSVTFRMGRVGYEWLLDECSQCGCSISGFVRSAVIREIADRRQRRKMHRVAAQLPGQMEIQGNDNA